MINKEEEKLIEDVIGFEGLYDSMFKCKKNVMWKSSTSAFYLNGIERTLKLEHQLKNNTYIPKPPRKFTITAPKKRDIVSISFKDRVYQRSLNDNVIYPIITKSFIYDNCACQKNKGTKFARDRLDLFLRKFYRTYKREGYILQCDIKGYYPNMSHQITEDIFKKSLPPKIYDMTQDILKRQYEGTVGYNPGSQMIQIAGISFLNTLDHYIKEQLHIKYYLRYMDDFILIHEDKEYLKLCQIKIEEKLKEVALILNLKKTKIFPIKKGVCFLGFTHKLNKNGKVIRLLNSDNVKRERKKLYRMVQLVKNGYMTRNKVEQCFQSWKAHAQNGNSFKLIQRMERYYNSLWR